MLPFIRSRNSFEGQKPDERVMLLLRRHWFTLVPPAVVLGVFALLPFGLYGYFPEELAALGLIPLFWFLVSLYFLFWWVALFYRLTLYLLDVWIVSDHRIIDSEQRGLFNRAVTEAQVGRVQDISVKLAGVIPTFLNYGNVEVQTAGAEQKIVFKQVPNPNAVKDTLMRAHDKFLTRHPKGFEQVL